jgi:hypothetical protein
METPPKLIFIVPYRNRQQQQAFFAKQMDYVLSTKTDTDYMILYIHQKDTREFNRGALKNIGFLIGQSMFPDYYKTITFVFNDVDTMPYTPDFLKYETTPGIVKHFYGFPFALGGIVSMTGGDFERINGFPNLWTWGYEDNMLQKRVLAAGGMRIDRSQFYPLADQNIIQFNAGITRDVNRVEFDRYIQNTREGWSSITALTYTIDPTEEDRIDQDARPFYRNQYFANVTQFSTGVDPNSSGTFAYDLRNGNTPFKTGVFRRGGRMPRMNMSM